MARVSDGLLQARIDLAAQASTHLLGEGEPAPLAIAIVGSTAHARCLPGSDLDLVAITADPPPQAVTSRDRDGVRIDVEWLTADQARRDAGQGGWTWELRKSARLGTALPLHDPDRLFAELWRLAERARPDPARFADQLESVERQLKGLARADCNPDAEALRGALDPLAMLVLMTNPRRYQKAKWLLDDLLYAGHTTLAGAIVDACGIGARPLPAVLAGARTYVETALKQAGEPDIATLVAMGHAPDHAASSYVARTLDDAEDLAESGGYEAAAHYTACFAARLASRLPDVADPLHDLAYRACFVGGAAPPRAIAAALAAAQSCRAWLAEESEAA